MDAEMEQLAMIGIFEALKKNKDFWAHWINDRIGPMADFFASSDDERKAAKDLGDALKLMSSMIEASQ